VVLPLGPCRIDGVPYLPHGKTILFAALDIAQTGALAYPRAHHRHEECLALLPHSDANMGVGLAVDNLHTHKHPKDENRLPARHALISRIRQSTPPGSTRSSVVRAPGPEDDRLRRPAVSPQFLDLTVVTQKSKNSRALEADLKRVE
jgi:hypothetical protein